MKHWSVDYSIKYKDGRITEEKATLEAKNISIAVGMALGNIRKPMLQNPDVQDVVIWDVGIIEEEVFDEG